MSEQNKALLRRFYEEVVGQGKLELIDELTAPTFVEHEENPGFTPDRDGVKQFFAMMLEAFPDMRFEIEDMIAEGDRVVGRVTMNGTHRGSFMGIDPTGKAISVQAIDIVRFADGKAVEHWGVTDQAAMMEQLGVSPG